jgi:hypothetical protein
MSPRKMYSSFPEKQNFQSFSSVILTNCCSNVLGIVPASVFFLFQDMINDVDKEGKPVQYTNFSKSLKS